MKEKAIKHVFLVGAKGLGFYGGFETFVHKLTEYHQNNSRIKYHVCCKANGEGSTARSRLEGIRYISADEFEYHHARCYSIKVWEIGPAQAYFYDVAAMNKCISVIERERIRNAVVYVLGCRIGPAFNGLVDRIHALGGEVYVNPDGHEWLRQKWSAPVRAYWKFSESIMVKKADKVICDSVNIEKYIHETYDTPAKRIQTAFIAYGSEIKDGREKDDRKFSVWLRDNNLEKGGYYLSVGRFVPENNYETMIREFMKSNSSKKFIMITTDNDGLYRKLENKLGFSKDDRIKFIGTIYDQELLSRIRENAYAYIHGHEVGGTNPSLLESLGSTDLNLVCDVSFNREVSGDAALYWKKKDGSLSALIDQADRLPEDKIEDYARKAKNRIREAYSWEIICSKYEELFLKE